MPHTFSNLGNQTSTSQTVNYNHLYGQDQFQSRPYGQSY